MSTGTIVLILAAIFLVLGISKRHHHAWVAFVAIVFTVALMRSAIAGPVEMLVGAIGTFFVAVGHAIGIG